MPWNLDIELESSVWTVTAIREIIMKELYGVYTLTAALIATSLLLGSPQKVVAEPTGIKNVVLVHGAFADGSGWAAVAKILEQDGYTVSVPQPPETSYADDQKYTKAAIDAMGGPVVLVGHSYGGSIRLIRPQGHESRLEDQAHLVHGGHFRSVDQSEPGADDGEARPCQDS